MKISKAMPRLAALVAASGIVLAVSSDAQAAEAANGGALAKRWCAACHVVAPDQRAGNPAVPPFAEIAKKPNFNAGTVALFLLAPHPQMPSMALSRAEAADIAAYIATQK